MFNEGTILQGSFTSTGANVNIPLRSSVDWMWVYNETRLYTVNALAAETVVQAYWRRGMADGRGLAYSRIAGANNPLVPRQLAANSGFFLYDSSGNPVKAAVAETGITNAAQPVVSTANTGALTTGSIVRLAGDTNVPNIMGFDFEVDTVVAGVSFRMRWPMVAAPGAVGAGDGTYRQIAFDPMYYPRHRFIVNITQAASAVVTTSVTHGYTVGQVVRFEVPSHFGMIELDNLAGTITAVDTANNTFTVNIDSSAFTAFAFAAVADYPFSFALVRPVGEDTAEALTAATDILADATYNTSAIGMTLVGGVGGPAGQNNDVISWIAGKSFSVDNS